MHTKTRRLALLGMLMGGLLGPGLMGPAQAAGATQVDGSGYYDDINGDECPAPPSEFSDYPALVLHGDLEGCLYAHVLSGHFTPSGVWIETGQELVVASLNGGPVATFETNYRFEGKYEAEFTVEIHGRCQHPVAAGSGTGAFAGVTGRLNFKDDVDNAMFYYRGHLTLG
jgi:hypothetical protein